MVNMITSLTRVVSSEPPDPDPARLGVKEELAVQFLHRL
jgi:hypothetical protein